MDEHSEVSDKIWQEMFLVCWRCLRMIPQLARRKYDPKMWSCDFASNLLYYTSNPVNTKHLYHIYTMLDQRRRRWADVV